MTDDATRVEALGALYQAEKTDAVGIFNAAMVLMTIILAYAGLSLSVFSDFGSKIPWRLAIWAPLPIWLIAVYLVMMSLNGMAHGISVSIIEGSLVRASGLRVDVRSYVGSSLSNKVMDVTRAPRLLKWATIYVYSGVFVASGYYTYYVMTTARGCVAAALWLGAATVYFASMLTVASTWVAGLRMINKAKDWVDDHPS